MKREAELDVRKKVCMHNNYEVTGFMSLPSSLNKSSLARILNALIDALHIKGVPPHYILVLADKNLVDYYTFLDKAMHWLFSGIKVFMAIEISYDICHESFACSLLD